MIQLLLGDVKHQSCWEKFTKVQAGGVGVAS